MEKIIYNYENYKKGVWSGGETTQMAIYPENSSYIDRDFIWRLSSAKVSTEESIFTKLPDYDRVLMVLEGEAVLAHDSESTMRLNEGQITYFDGGAKTKCFGKIKDYNLMVRKGCTGKLFLMEAQNSLQEIKREKNEEYTHQSYGIYCLTGYVVVSCNGETDIVKQGCQMVVNLEQSEDVTIGVMGEGRAIISEILYSKLSHAPVEIPEEKASFDDFITAFKVARTRNKWSQMMRRKNKVWYDEAMKKKLDFIDKSYLEIIIWVIVFIIVLSLAIKGILSVGFAFILIALWTVIHGLVVTPIIYLMILPKPIRAHIKAVDSLTEYERRIYEQEMSKNDMTDKILKKYKYSGKENCDENYETIFSKLKNK